MANDTLEQLRAAQAYAVELEARLAELESELSSMEIMCTDHEADHRRWSDEAEADRDRWKARAEAAEARLSGVDVHDIELLRAERAGLAAVIGQINALADRWEYGATRWADPLPVPREVEQVREITRQVDTDAVLREVRAEAWDGGALWAAVECAAIASESEPWLAPGDNPYRTEGSNDHEGHEFCDTRLGCVLSEGSNDQ